MILCDNCGRENQDHYKFCLGCGAELKREAAQPKRFTEPTPPAGVPAVSAEVQPAPAFGGAPVRAAMPRQGAPVPSASPPAPVREAAFAPTAAIAATAPAGAFGGAAAAPVGVAPAAPGPVAHGGALRGAALPGAALPGAALHGAASHGAGPQGGAAAVAPAAETIACPTCGQVNPRSFKFCGACGFNLKDWIAQGQPPLSAGAAGPSVAPMPGAAAAAVAPRMGAGAALVVIRPDGSEGERIRIEGTLVVGRGAGGPFAQDTYLSPHHARFEVVGGRVTIVDEGSLNGVYVRLEREVPRELNDGDIFRIGQEIIRFERIADPMTDPDGVELMGGPSPGYLGRICLVVGRETTANCFCVPKDGIHLGRERGDIVFPDDGYVSGLHCRIHGESGRVLLTDVGSSNGTFFRVDGTEQVPPGTLVLMGQQLFRIEL